MPEQLSLSLPQQQMQPTHVQPDQPEPYGRSRSQLFSGQQSDGCKTDR